MPGDPDCRRSHVRFLTEEGGTDVKTQSSMKYSLMMTQHHRRHDLRHVRRIVVPDLCFQNHLRDLLAAHLRVLAHLRELVVTKMAEQTLLVN